MRIQSQVLDGTYGKPASGVSALLSRAVGANGWVMVGRSETDNDGRVQEWETSIHEHGLYRILFDSDAYFAKLGLTSAYPEVTVIFRIQDKSQNFQVQVTLTPYSYSTYFGTLGDHSDSSKMGAAGGTGY